MNPFDLIAKKQKLGPEYAEDAELFVMLHFDAAKRGQCNGAGYNFISHHLIIAYFIAAKLKMPRMMAVIQSASDAWNKAGARPTEKADLTTTEYKAMCAALKIYFHALPKVEVGLYKQASDVADKIIC